MNEDLAKFLTYTDSQREPSLVLVTDDNELAECKKILIEQQFKQVMTLAELVDATTHPSKTFYILSEMTPALYDFIYLYPRGQIQIYDPESNKQLIVTPIYTNVSLILLTTHALLEQIDKTRLSIRDKVGLVYQK
jgi:hypothetical protein